MAKIVTIDGIPVYQALVESEGDTGMLRISLVDDPAVQSDFLAFKAEERRRVQTYAVQDEDKHLVLGVVMRADFPIYRRDADGFEYYIIYKADTIRTMAEKYLAESRQNMVSTMHREGSDVDGVQMVQYFIKGEGLNPAGFDGIADGSLFAEFHVTNEDVWSAIKEGTYKGFSLEGLFDLVPEHDAEDVQRIVDTLEGKFRTILKNHNMAKLKGLLARLAKAIVSLGNITTDKGILSWDGDEDLKAGDAVFIEDADGNRNAAEDGDYVTEDGKTITVVDGKVADIADPKAEVAPAPAEEEPAEAARMVQTDKGKLEWDNEDEDLKAGDAVYITDEEGNRNPAPDGEYTTEDGKVISVVDGKVASITDPKAEVDAAKKKGGCMSRIAQAFAESYDEKFRKIENAIATLGYEDFWVVDAGDDFAVAEVWDADRGNYYLRFKVSWDEAGDAMVSDPVEVVPAFVTPEERDTADAEFAAIKEDIATLRKKVAELSRQPAGKPAHEEFSGQGSKTPVTGNRGIDRLAQLMDA